MSSSNISLGDGGQSRDAHTFHERWTARRALELVFPSDGLFAISVEGPSPTEQANLGKPTEEVADLVLYYGGGDNFTACDRLEIAQFKYKFKGEPVTSSYLKKTIKKFAEAILGHEKSFASVDIDEKVSFLFVTNAEFSENLWDALRSLASGTLPCSTRAKSQANFLETWVKDSGLDDPRRLFSRIHFKADEKDLGALSGSLKRTVTDWSSGVDTQGRLNLQGLQELVRKKSGAEGAGKNVIRREDVLDALDCDLEELFPAKALFVDVGSVVERVELSTVEDRLKTCMTAVFLHADGGVGKTVFVQRFAAKAAEEYEVVTFDCFGGGVYRSQNQARHLPSIGLVQIVNELAARTLCDPLLPRGDDARRIVKTARKRLKQAAVAVRSQSGKLGLLIIIDAADNAQLEADDRKEDSFPKSLLSALSEEPIDGVKLLLTGRSHRKDDVIGCSSVEEVELGPFTESEAREFLIKRVPDASKIEVTVALARSLMNPRILDYLVQTWDRNIQVGASNAPVSVTEIIASRCDEIVSDLKTAGWSQVEISNFFVGLSFLPPPIPLEELAIALSWPATQVNSAAADLAPMLEVTSQGVIFRDEPTESYIRETYSDNVEAQSAIATQLLASQATSSYAAEALPHFLVVINDDDRAFELADSTEFPGVVTTEFGQRRLKLARLRAAFRLAVSQANFDRVLSLSVRLGQVTVANSRGDEVIRKSPELAIILGDLDAYRRLYADRTGWRGARSARLTIAHCFSGNPQEARIESRNATRWINWSIEQPDELHGYAREAPSKMDFAAVLLQRVVDGELSVVDNSLDKLVDTFATSVCIELLTLLEKFDLGNSTATIASLVNFALSGQSKSQVLKVVLLANSRHLTNTEVKRLVNIVSKFKKGASDEVNVSVGIGNQLGEHEVVYAAFAALLHGTKAATKRIIDLSAAPRISVHSYCERYSHSNAWFPLFIVCIKSWAAGRPLAYHDLLPEEVDITRTARKISCNAEMKGFLEALEKPKPETQTGGVGEKSRSKLFSRREAEDICSAINLILALSAPIQESILSGKGLSPASVSTFLDAWKKYSKGTLVGREETAADVLARTLGQSFAGLLITNASDFSVEHANTVVGILCSGRSTSDEMTIVLNQFARKPALHTVAGEFAQKIAKRIGQDEYIESRGDSYLMLAAALMPMSIHEAREYYRLGVEQLDQLGGESYQEIHSLLNFASAQNGGFVKPDLAQRLMNICEPIVRNEPTKFLWTSLARAAAKSIGSAAIAKLVRWNDQDVADMSYGLPQLACALARDGHLDPRRAAFLLLICADHGWYDWSAADGLEDLLLSSEAACRKEIFQVIVAKFRAEYVFGDSHTIWERFIDIDRQYPGLIANEEMASIEEFRNEARGKREEVDVRQTESFRVSKGASAEANEVEIDAAIAIIALKCDVSSALSIDDAIRCVKSDDNFSYTASELLIANLSSNCPYPDRLEFLKAICESEELGFSRVLDILAKSLSEWETSSKSLTKHKPDLVKLVLEYQSADMFAYFFGSLARAVTALSAFCDDAEFVPKLILRKVAQEQVELSGDQWLQLAAVLCDMASDRAGLDALELLLSSSTCQLADQTGEGAFVAQQEIVQGEADFIADVTWHTLGNSDADIRWAASRGLQSLFELGLDDDLSLLLKRFDTREIPTLVSANKRLAFQNSQQWLLMGLARAAVYNGEGMGFLSPELLALSKRDDLHVINKTHVIRCLEQINGTALPKKDLEGLKTEVNRPSAGIICRPARVYDEAATSEFSFGYDFLQTDVNFVARMFNVTDTVVLNAMAQEIRLRWPDANGMECFPEPARYRYDSRDRYERFSEHVQRHALLNAVTTLSKIRPVVVESYDVKVLSPWLEWRDRYDVTFDDGLWLSDRKDPVPSQAKKYLSGPRVGNQETLLDQGVLLSRLGIADVATDAMVPLYGQWKSPDGVTVSIRSALTRKWGAVGQCTKLSKAPSYDLWLPQCWDGGYYNADQRRASAFSALVWSPEKHQIGIDVCDKLGALGPVERPRLGIEYTKKLGLVAGSKLGDWLAEDGRVSMKSQVWGRLSSDPDQMNTRYNDDGALLSASPDWLSEVLRDMKQRLVFTVTLASHGNPSAYSRIYGVQSVIVALMGNDMETRFWRATEE